ncbi:hypothetical protein FGU46_03115 [Methanobacterium sp. CWC-01]|uniref:hypothetical protein n=1 Tax=Methanobacterium aridiramus TaxID=2584467 RepID=UPI00257850C1|nr:hypothetical protein [Methanobacterium sp. CWC-01]WJI09150.1 hypothetical protein FGU46_03115 [Methanobacterium sp. CWC-01]
MASPCFLTPEGWEAQRIKEDGRKYELALAPLKRLLQTGSKSPLMRRNHKMSEAALLAYRRAVEDYALALAGEIGLIAEDEMRSTLMYRDVLLASTLLKAKIVDDIRPREEEAESHV